MTAVDSGGGSGEDNDGKCDGTGDDQTTTSNNHNTTKATSLLLPRMLPANRAVVTNPRSVASATYVPPPPLSLERATQQQSRGAAAASLAASAVIPSAAPVPDGEQGVGVGATARTGKRRLGATRGAETGAPAWGVSDADRRRKRGETGLIRSVAVDPRENIVERQKEYDLNDRYLRVLMQRTFESERLPFLFAARSSSRLHRYTVNDAYEMARKQAARMPALNWEN